jgi:tetratricopeptide (TPR) repeat protein
MSLARHKMAWLTAITVLLGLAASLFIFFIRPFLVAQCDRDWQRDRLEGQRRYVDSQYKLAEIAYKKALNDLAAGGRQSEDLAATLNESARIELLLNNYDQSEKEFSRAALIYKRLLGVNAPSEKNIRQLLEEGLIRSISGLAQVHRAQGQKGLAKFEYEQLFPLYAQWWQSQDFGEVEADLFHRGKHKPKMQAPVTKADLVICAQMAGDLTDLASIYVNDGRFNLARKVSYTLADLCSKAPISNTLKAKADVVYHRAFNVRESESGIVNQM